MERAQKKVESRNFDIRKTLLKFDDVMNDQRQVIFEQRREILNSNNINDIINSFNKEIISNFYIEKENYQKKISLDHLKLKLNRY